MHNHTVHVRFKQQRSFLVLHSTQHVDVIFPQSFTTLVHINALFCIMLLFTFTFPVLHNSLISHVIFITALTFTTRLWWNDFYQQFCAPFSTHFCFIMMLRYVTILPSTTGEHVPSTILPCYSGFSLHAHWLPVCWLFTVHMCSGY